MLACKKSEDESERKEWLLLVFMQILLLIQTIASLHLNLQVKADLYEVNNNEVGSTLCINLNRTFLQMKGSHKCI